MALHKGGNPPKNFSISVSLESIDFFPPAEGEKSRGTSTKEKALLAQLNVTSELSLERKDGVITIYSNGHQFTFSEEESVNQYNYLLLTAGSIKDTEYRFPGKVIVEDLVIAELED